MMHLNDKAHFSFVGLFNGIVLNKFASTPNHEVNQ